MSKASILGNGKLTIGLDKFGQLYDLYFPYVGLENHTGGSFVHKIGVWIDDKLFWIDDGTWEVQYEENLLVNQIKTTHISTGITIRFTDSVYNEKDIFLRNLEIFNDSGQTRTVKVFFNHQFQIYESHRGDTAYYNPDGNVVVHYKGRRTFLINATNVTDNNPFDDYSIGLFGIEGREGTYMDAMDGKLGKNPIEHGSVDSVIGLNLNTVESGSSKTVEYWLCVAKEVHEVTTLNNYVLDKTHNYLINSAKSYWSAWIHQKDYNFCNLEQNYIDLFYTSLKVIRLHTDNTGAIVASIDSDLLKYGRDMYSYVWPRDAAFTSIAFTRARFNEVNEEIFNFFSEIITDEGFFMHKYRSDKSLGSSWHPWIYDGKKELPIQLDETALIIYALWQNYKITKDVEYLEKMYNSLVKKATEFLITRINKETGVVKPSYDLWEERFGSGTFTSCTVYAALKAAANFAEILGKNKKSSEYRAYAQKIRDGILKYHYNKKEQYFYKNILGHDENIHSNSEVKTEDVIDSSSLYGLFYFEVLDIEDERLIQMKNKVYDKLFCKNGAGGFARYEKDNYFKVNNSITGNPWILTTLWYAQLEIRSAKDIDSLNKCKFYLEWAYNKASKGGMLSEQLDPFNSTQISATPLTWSHAEYIVTVMDYCEKYKELQGSSTNKKVKEICEDR